MSGNHYRPNREFAQNNPFFATYVMPLTLKSQLCWVVYFSLALMALNAELLYQSRVVHETYEFYRQAIPRISLIVNLSVDPEGMKAAVSMVYTEIIIGMLLCPLFVFSNKGPLVVGIGNRNAVSMILLSLLAFLTIVLLLHGNTLPTGATRKGRIAYYLMTDPSSLVFYFWIIGHTALALEYVLFVAIKKSFDRQ